MVVTAVRLGFTARPIATPSSASARWYSATQARSSSGSTNANVSTPRPCRAASRMVSPARAGDPQWRVGLLQRLGNDVSRRHRDVLALVAGERLLGQAAQRDLETLTPHGALVVRIDAEALDLHRRGGLAGAELDTAARHEVEGGDPLGHTAGWLNGGGHPLSRSTKRLGGPVHHGMLGVPAGCPLAAVRQQEARGSEPALAAEMA